MKKFKYAILALAVLAVGSLAVTQPFVAGGLKYIKPVSDYTLNDENPIILLKYVGTQESGTVDLVTNSFQFHIGDETSEAAPTDEGAADVNVGDVCGSTAGSLDVTDAQCNTFGELVDVINANSSDHGWLAVLVGALHDEVIAGATDFLDPADALCKAYGGCALFADSSVHDETVALFAPWINEAFDGTSAGREGKMNIEPFLTRGSGGGQSQVLRGDPIPDDYIPFLQNWMIYQDGTGSGNFQVYSLDFANTGLNDFTAGDGTPAYRLVFQEPITDATAMNSDVQWIHSPLAGDAGTILLIRGSGFTALTDTNDELRFSGFYAQAP